MMTEIEARSILREAQAELKSITENKSLSNDRKSVKMSAIEAEVKVATDALRNIQAGRAFSLGAGDIDADTKSQPLPLGLSRENLKSLHAAAQAGQNLTVKTPILTTDDAPGLVPQRILPPLPAAREPFRVASVLPQLAVPGPVQYYRTTGSNAAAVTAEGATKPLGKPVVAGFTATPIKIAVRAQVSDEAINDFGGFLGILTGDLTNDLINAENNYLLNDSTAGLLHVAGTQSYDPPVGETPLDALLGGATQLRTTGRFTEPDVFILNPTDYKAMRTAKASTSGVYLAGDPLASGPLELWGTKVVLTTQLAAGTAIVANLQEAAQLFVREGITTKLGHSGTDFEQNLNTLIVEERFSLGVIAPSAICVTLLAHV